MVCVSAAVAGLFSLQLGILSLFLAAIGWWTYEHPETAFRLFIILAPLLPMFKQTQTISDITLAKDVLIIVLWIKTFIKPLTTKQLPYRRLHIFVPFLLLLVWTAFNWLRADSFTLGLLRTRDIVLYMLLYLGVAFLPHNRQLMKERLLWLTGSAVVICLLGWYQWFFAIDSAVLRFDPIARLWIPRLSSTFAHPTVFGEYLVILATLASAFILIKRGWQRWAGGAALAALLPLIYLTYSRGVWLGLLAAWAAMGAWYAWQAFRQRLTKQVWLTFLKYILGFVMVAGLLLFATPAGSFLRATFDSKYSSNAIRLNFAVRLLASLSNTEALIGRGLGDVTAQNFRQVDVSASDITSGAARTVQLSKDSTLVDNQYLKTFVEMGLVGILLYGWLYMRLIRATAPTSLFNLWFVATLAAFLVEALFVDIWDVFPTNAFFWIMAGLLAAYATPDASSASLRK